MRDADCGGRSALGRSKTNSLILLVLVFGLFMIGGCARNISSSSYGTVGSASQTYECTVISVRKVAVTEGDRLEDNKSGALMGAVAGGALGNMIGGGRARIATTAAGALAGGVGGAMLERNMKTQEGLEYVVRLRSGEMRTVVQGLDNPLYRGQKALLIIDESRGGRSRVVPLGY